MSNSFILTRASGESIYIHHLNHPDDEPLKITIRKRKPDGLDELVLECRGNPDLIVIRDDLYERQDFDLQGFFDERA